MALLNIDTSNDDPFYRYKMPKLIAKVCGYLFVRVAYPRNSVLVCMRCCGYAHPVHVINAFASLSIPVRPFLRA